MDEADLAIGAASSASWERCALGLPALLVTLADNQVAAERLLVEAGAAGSLGWHDAVSAAEIERAVRSAPGRPGACRGDVRGGRGRDRRPGDGAGRGRDRIDRGKQDGGEMSGDGMTTPTLAPFAINGRRIGPGHPVYVIAEISSNHGQRFEAAVELVRGAYAAGADAVKLQTYTPDTITIDADSPAFVSGEGSLWEGTTLHALYETAYMPWDWQPKLKAIAGDLGMDLFSAPFDPTAVDFLEAMDVPAYKIASFELVDLPLIRMVARTGRPMIMSTGMATDDEIDEAVAAARDGGATDIALLKCSSAYPSPPESVNLRAIQTMAERWRCRSDCRTTRRAWRSRRRPSRSVPRSSRST